MRLPPSRTDPCAHRWRPLSRHPVSDGTVVYERCRCGRVRVLHVTEVAFGVAG